MIRTAVLEDVDSMVDVATVSRFAFTAWDGDLWRTDTVGAAANQLLLRAQIESDAHVTLVAAMADRVVGWGRVVRGTAVEPWTVADLAISADADWLTIGRALLVAIAAKVRASGARGMVVPTPNADRLRAELLLDAGLSRVAAAGHRRVIRTADHPPHGVRAYVAADAEEVERLTAGKRSMAGGLAGTDGRNDGLVVDDGDGVIGVAVVRRVTRSSVTLAMARGVVIVEPFEVAANASWSDIGERLLGGVEWLAARSDASHLVVPSRLDDEQKVATIDARGEGWPVDIWALEW